MEAILAQDRRAIEGLSAELRASGSRSNQLTVIPWVRLTLDLGENMRDLSREAKATVKELRDALTNAAELEVELANAQQRYLRKLGRL